MKKFVPWLSAIFWSVAVIAFLEAQPFPCGPPVAPDACGPGFYSSNCYGAVYGPNYWLRPGFPPFAPALPCPGMGGMGAGMGGGQGQGQGMRGMAAFPSHPFARSPRDYFMMEQ